MRARLAALHASRRGEAAPAGSSGADNAFLSELADQKRASWLQMHAEGRLIEMGGLLPPAEALASQLASLLRDSGGGPVLRAEAALASLLSLDYKGEALERIALRCPLVLPALAAALRTDDRQCLARRALINGLQRPRMVAPVLEAAPSLIPELLENLLGPLASAKLAASEVSRIARGCSGARAEVESWGALHALVDVAAAAARCAEAITAC
jgi:hypothetical protein